LSSIAYGALTRKRNAGEKGKSTSEDAPGVKTYIDALAALVPAEVLAVHATIMTFTTSTSDDGSETTTITEPGTLEWVFWVLLAASAALYIFGLKHRPYGYGWLRLLIPPTAFVGWAMLQNPSVFDAIDTSLAQSDRTAIALSGALILGPLAAALGSKADDSPSEDRDKEG
jgi:hypothetical protein